MLPRLPAPPVWGMLMSPFPENRQKDSEAVAEGLQVGLAMEAVRLVAGHLRDPHTRIGHAQVDQSLNLEAGDVERDERQAPSPEGVVAVAEVGEAGAIEQIDDAAQPVVPQPAERRDVDASPTRDEARALGEVGPRLERCHKA